MCQESRELFRLGIDYIGYSGYEDENYVYKDYADAVTCTGDTATAILFYQKCLEINPGNIGASANLRNLKGMWILGPRLSNFIVERPLVVLAIVVGLIAIPAVIYKLRLTSNVSSCES